MWKRILLEFKEFAIRGNMIDMAIGITVGVAFGKISTSFVTDIFMPPVGFLFGKVNFRDLYINLSGKEYVSLDVAKAAGAPTINVGVFLNNIFDFAIIAVAVFFLVKIINQIRQPLHKVDKPAEKEAETKECPYCLEDVPVRATRCSHCTSSIAD
jgi:large conductance mechanosensitive channel